jgi:hypothetical protein
MDAGKTYPGVRRWLSAARNDDGMALATVTAIAAILFLLATTLLMLSTQQQVSASNQVQRTKALQAADAGISAYLYELSRNSHYQATESSRTADASWTVTAAPPEPGSPVTVLTAVGSVPAVGGSPAVTRTVMARVRPASFSDYMFLMNHYLNLGSGGLVKGNVRSNEYVNNDGEITGYVYAAEYISGSGVFDKYPLHPNYGTQSFAVVDYANMKSLASGDGTYWGDSGNFGTSPNLRHYLGYCLTLSGLGGTVAKVQSISTTSGAMVTDAPVSFTTPPNGVLYFEDPVWVSGTYGAKVTIAVGKDVEGPASSDSLTHQAPGPDGMNPAGSTLPRPNNANSSVYLWKNLQSSNPANADLVCGIVSQGDISFTSEYPDPPTPTNLTIQAALLSTMGSIHADWGNNRLKNHLRILGAMAQWDEGFVKYSSWSGTLGFNTRDYWYDPNLDVTTPPNFPPLGDGKLRVRSWVEH